MKDNTVYTSTFISIDLSVVGKLPLQNWVPNTMSHIIPVQSFLICNVLSSCNIKYCNLV